MKKLILILFLGMSLLTVTRVFSQPPPPPSFPDKPQQTPIDGGLALLAAAGGGYAIKKLREKKSQ